MPYKRIVSLVPSLSELLIDLGVKEWLVGRTKFCIHPQPAIQHIPVIGGTKNPNLEKIIALNPDLIVANKEENQKEDIEFLSKHTEVLVTEIGSISSALDQIKHIGKRLDVEANADKLISEINSELDSLKTYQEVSCVYFIWKDPWMSVGRDTYIHDVMNTFGLKNLLAGKTRYPAISLSGLKELKPELILLSSEPFPFKEQHIVEVKKACPSSNIQLVDGEWFSWYGSRMTYAFRKLKNWRTFI